MGRAIPGYLFLFLGILYYFSEYYTVTPVVASSHTYVNVTGDVILGALFPIHEYEEGVGCGTFILDQDGLQLLEAMLFAIRKVNAELLNSTGIKLGALAFDTCNSDTVALQRSLEFVNIKVQGIDVDDHNAWECGDGKLPKHRHDRSRNNIIGVIGALSSSVSIQVARFLQLFDMPQVSYLSTSAELSNKEKFAYFKRTVPSDVHQAHAILAILKRLDWSYVTVVYDDTSYGQQGYEQLKLQADNHSVCIANDFRMARYFPSEQAKIDRMKYIVGELEKISNTNGKIVVIIYSAMALATSLLQVASNRPNPDRYLWVVSDSITGRSFSHHVQSIAGGAIGIQPLAKDYPEFNNYFTSLKPSMNKDNKWFREYWEQLFDCTFEKHTLRSGDTPVQKCTEGEVLSEEKRTYQKNLNAYFVMDAVLVFAYALKAMHEDRCPPGTGVCTNMNISGATMLEYMTNVSFTDFVGLPFQFVDGRDGPSRYSAAYFTKFSEGGRSKQYSWKPVGLFNVFDPDIMFRSMDASLNNSRGDRDPLRLNTSALDMEEMLPSYCSLPCKAGQSKSQLQKCCWSCSTCGDYQYLPDENTCDDCPEGEIPNDNFTGCDPLELTAMSYDNAWAIVLVTLSSLAIAVTIAVAAIFYVSRDTPIIKASGKELSFVLLAGILMSYIAIFVLVAYPTPITCGATRLFLGVCYTLCYAAILVKTNLIYRVFNIKGNKPKKVKFISAKSQLLITAGIVLVELAAIVTWFVFQPPTTEHIYPTMNENILVCADSKTFAYLGVLVYPFVLIILCIIYAIMTRKTPDGFNETKFIAFGSYSFCVMWLAFVPVYFTLDDNTIRIIILCMAMFVNATVTLVTLFITKVYVVLFKPQKNTKENVMARRRARSYESVDIDKMSHLSKFGGGAVSTCYSSHLDSAITEIPPSPNKKANSDNELLSPNKNQLSVSVISLNELKDSKTSLASTSSAPVRRVTISDILVSEDGGGTQSAENISKKEKAKPSIRNGVRFTDGYLKPFQGTRKPIRSKEEDEKGKENGNAPSIIVTKEMEGDDEVF